MMRPAPGGPSRPPQTEDGVSVPHLRFRRLQDIRPTRYSRLARHMPRAVINEAPGDEDEEKLDRGGRNKMNLHERLRDRPVQQAPDW